MKKQLLIYEHALSLYQKWSDMTVDIVVSKYQIQKIEEEEQDTLNIFLAEYFSKYTSILIFLKIHIQVRLDLKH